MVGVSIIRPFMIFNAFWFLFKVLDVLSPSIDDCIHVHHNWEWLWVDEIELNERTRVYTFADYLARGPLKLDELTFDLSLTFTQYIFFEKMRLRSKASSSNFYGLRAWCANKPGKKPILKWIIFWRILFISCFQPVFC